MDFRLLRERVTFQKRDVDSVTGGLTDWVNHITVWGRLEDISGRDYLQAQTLGDASIVTSKITIRWRPDWQVLLSPHMRIRVGGRTFNIKAIVPDGKGYLEIMCVELR